MPIHELRVSYTERVPLAENQDLASIKNSRAAVSLMTPVLEPEAVEVCYVLCLTTRLTLIGYHEVSRGSLDAALMHPREIFKVAMLTNAAAIIIVHNHPSGDPSPSPDDIGLTRRLKKAGQLLGIDLLDHVIIGHEGRFVSLKEQGRL